MICVSPSNWMKLCLRVFFLTASSKLNLEQPLVPSIGCDSYRLKSLFFSSGMGLQSVLQQEGDESAVGTKLCLSIDNPPKLTNNNVITFRGYTVCLTSMQKFVTIRVSLQILIQMLKGMHERIFNSIAGLVWNCNQQSLCKHQELFIAIVYDILQRLNNVVLCAVFQNYMELQKTLSEQLELSDRQALEYFNASIKPLYSTLITSIIKSKPEDILEYCTKWFRDRKGIESNTECNSSQDGDDYARFETIDDEEFKQMKYEKLQRARKKRYGLSSEKSCRNSIKVQNGERKEENTYMRILFFCMSSFLFNNFSEKEIGELIEKMKREKIEKDREVCREGDYGDRMYFVDEGIFECIQQTEKGPKSIKNYYVGDTFGEICLLHMMRRQASIYCRSDEGILYTLDRQSYVHFKKMCMIKKRTLYLCTLMKQQFFKSFNEQELQKICDVLIEVQYEQGQIVINQGDVGSKFFIIIDGILLAYKQREDNIVCCYKEGDAFGEIALIKDMPRQASVKTLTRCRMVYMTREVFRRIFQNVDLEKEIDEKYGNKGNLINKRRFDNTDQVKDKEKQGKRISIRPQRPGLALF